jgi:hypothetical protein
MVAAVDAMAIVVATGFGLQNIDYQKWITDVWTIA